MDLRALIAGGLVWLIFTMLRRGSRSGAGAGAASGERHGNACGLLHRCRGCGALAPADAGRQGTSAAGFLCGDCARQGE